MDPENAQAVMHYIQDLKDKVIVLPSENEVKMLAASVKERKGKYLLIYRYEITKQNNNILPDMDFL
ncbi:hypothetical protein [Dethiosulfatibacter aminovorans]|nr:hypothetical protein [Dethiosulfatibacter aminovorans]